MPRLWRDGSEACLNNVALPINPIDEGISGQELIVRFGEEFLKRRLQLFHGGRVSRVVAQVVQLLGIGQIVVKLGLARVLCQNSAFLK